MVPAKVQVIAQPFFISPRELFVIGLFRKYFSNCSSNAEGISSIENPRFYIF